ncbi:HAD family hydrolase [Desertimonas flava]|uniref:HAD family hydrolase n=1 Tax=Desertimonas flava TaxID=2064846 RepID=UPI000E354B33|nr:HAD family phosphatase [Desertimonas flava]
MPSPEPSRRVDAVVFDLGGVILDLAGLKAFLQRHRLDLGTFFAKALGSGAHFDFERGALDTDSYVDAFLAETGVVLDRAEFIAEFAAWPGDLLPGAAELVAEVRAAGVTTATLSNTNVIHWTTPFCETTILPMFDRHFPSYQLGLAKPDEAIFRRVVDELGLDAGRVAFFDDNLVNAEAAAAVGLEAHHVQGPDEARAVLAELGVL